MPSFNRDYNKLQSTTLLARYSSNFFMFQKLSDKPCWVDRVNSTLNCVVYKLTVVQSYDANNVKYAKFKLFK